MIPTVGLEVIYKDHIGTIRFVDEHYVTLCINQFKERSRDVCIVINRENFKHLRLLKESDK